MQKLSIITVLLVVGLQSQAQTTDTATSKPCITETGKPFGEVASKKINSDGGSITSTDNSLEIIFPAGAVDKETEISIQPISNNLAENNEGAYRLEPSGIQFKKPVQLVFHFRDTGNSALSQNIATQNEKGQWIALKRVTTDTVNKTISGHIPHFSDWALFSHYSLMPVKAKIKVSGSQLLEVRHLTQQKEQEMNEFVAYGVPLVTEKIKTDKWTVNGIDNGNGETGTIAESSLRWGIYVAPQKVPKQNPVTVTAYFSGTYFTLEGERFKKFSLSSNITILDNGYRYTFIGVSNNINGVFKQLDSSSCEIYIEDNKPVVKNIINYKPWSDKPPTNKRGCSLTYPSFDSWKGPVEIQGMQSGSITSATENNPVTSITVAFVPAFGNNPEIIEDCKCRGCTIRHLPSLPMPAQPNYARFETNGNDITIEYKGIKRKNEISHIVNGEGFVIKVTRL